MLRTHSRLMVMLLLAFPPGVVAHDAAADSSLTLVNMSASALSSFPVSVRIPAGAAGLSAASETGAIPCQADPDDLSRLWLSVDLAPRRRSVVRLAAGAPVPSASAARWDAAANRGGIDNGVVRLDINGMDVACSLPGVPDVLDGLNFYGWLGDTPEAVPSAVVAQQRGLPGISTRTFDSITGRIVADGSACTVLELCKEAGGAVRGLAFTERFTVFAGRPDIEYQVTVRNNRDRPAYITDCDGLLYGHWGKGLPAPRRLYTSGGQGGTVLSEWLAMSLPGLTPERRAWAAVTNDRGPTVGLVKLAGNEETWAFTGDSFYLYLSDLQGKRPIRLDPGAESTWGLLITLPTGGGPTAADAVQQRYAWSRRSPVTAYMDGQPQVYGATTALREDFRTVDHWLVAGGQLALADGGARLSVAPGSEDATASCALSLPIETGTALFLDVAAMSPGARLRVIGQMAEGAVLQLADARQAGALHIPWPSQAVAPGWKDLDLRLVLEGQGASAQIRSLSLGAGASAPVPLTPFDGQPITDLAAFCSWKSVPHAGRYELQVSRRADFADARTVRAPALDADKSVWMPEELPATGLWHWRVRAITDDAEVGDWSPARSFTVSQPGPPRAPARAPSSAMPLFLLHAPSDIAVAWKAIPEDLRPYCALRVEVAERDLDLKAFCHAAQANNINVVIQGSGPGGGVYGELYNEHYGRQSLSELEWALRNCPNVIGALVCEQNFHIRSDASSAEYVRRLADLVTSHGKLLIFADGHWGSFAWLKMGSDERLYDIFRKHPHNVVPLWKMNCAQVPLTIHGAVLGYWTAGTVDQFGVEPEDWYWFEAGFKKLGEATGILNGGDHEMLPPSFWGNMILTGLASGAACYCLEPYTAMWKYDHPDQPTDAWKRVIRPLLLAIARRGLVPSRQTVMVATKIAVQTRPEDLEFSPNFGAFRTMYDTLYGIRHPAEVIPDNARYGFIPLLPPLAANALLPRGAERVTLDRLATPQAVHAVFDPLYPPVAEGDAFARFIGDTLVAMNNRENEDVTEHFEIPLGMRGLRSLGGSLGPHSFVTGQRQPGRLWLQVNGRQERSATLLVRAKTCPRVTFPPGNVDVQAAWNAAEGTLTLTVSHRAGAAEVTVDDVP